MKMKSDATIKKEGIEALKQKLDSLEIEKFLTLMKREQFDYTKWRKNLFEDMTIEELAEKADKYSEKLDTE